ncbi:hypothetical protein MPH48_07865 [Lysinibacillus fusiformis]|uniref:hypothetical protein n=1 Tax=Lysinibacillus fusiformis TaxID=28031 RepID=UPI001F4E45EA|nr:hypothetical protein [Lysinibacillus fusiformis]MCK1988023.1 hypothetical protein [Lysinibacillus fusiformis]
MSIHIQCLPHLSGLPNVHEEDMPKDALHQQVVDFYVPAFEITLLVIGELCFSQSVGPSLGSIYFRQYSPLCLSNIMILLSFGEINSSLNCSFFVYRLVRM